jgi:DNA-directed RNA polymerase specialized sigma24 family protein
VTKHAWCDFLAARKQDPGRTAGPLDAIADSADAQSDLERQLEDAFEAELLELAMHRVKNRVNPATWQAFQLTAVEGLAGADAAQNLQIPVAHVFVAKNRVQKMLQEEARILRNGKR